MCGSRGSRRSRVCRAAFAAPLQVVGIRVDTRLDRTEKRPELMDTEQLLCRAPAQNVYARRASSNFATSRKSAMKPST